MNNNITLNLEELKDFTPWLKAVVRTGSTTIPWINSPHDVDYIFFVQDLKNGALLEGVFNTFRKNGNCIGIRQQWAHNNVPWLYEYHYVKLIFGSIEIPQYDIFTMSKHCKKVIVNCYDAILERHDKQAKKDWYHVLTTIYLLQNGDYYLTEEQKENVNFIHDNKFIPDNLYEYVGEAVEQYRQELKE